MTVQPVILFYNSYFGESLEIFDMPAGHEAIFTSDRTLMETADAVVFHIPSLEKIDGLAKRPGQLWVLWSMESSINYPCMADRSFLKLFDLRMTYERDADVWMPYMQYDRYWDDFLSRPLPEKTEGAPLVMFQSAPANQSGRISYAKTLMQHIKVDSYGKVLNNRTLPDGKIRTNWRSAKMATIASYKFCLAMENSIVDDYVTEKFFDPLMLGTVPVYLGAPNVDRFSPGDKAYIDVRDFSGPKDLAEYLNDLDRDDTAYQEFLAWRPKPLRQSFRDDLARRGSEMGHLVDIVKARLTEAPRPFDQHARLSFDPYLATPRPSLRKLEYRVRHALGLKAQY